MALPPMTIRLWDGEARLANIANDYRPGTATYVELPGAMHGMEQVGGRNASRG